LNEFALLGKVYEEMLRSISWELYVHKNIIGNEKVLFNKKYLKVIPIENVQCSNTLNIFYIVLYSFLF